MSNIDPDDLIRETRLRGAMDAARYADLTFLFRLLDETRAQRDELRQPWAAGARLASKDLAAAVVDVRELWKELSKLRKEVSALEKAMRSKPQKSSNE